MEVTSDGRLTWTIPPDAAGFYPFTIKLRSGNTTWSYSAYVSVRANR